MQLAMLAAGLSNPEMFRDNFKEESIKVVKEPLIPKGAGKYNFAQDGSFVMEGSEEIVFTCFARDEQNAKRKFKNKFKN